MIAFKGGVRVQTLTDSLVHILNCVENTRNELGYPNIAVVTSVNDGSHSRVPLSRHYTDEAVDVRTRNRSAAGNAGIGDMGTRANKIRFAERLAEKLGSRFYVKVKPYLGKPNEHIHVQVRKGHTYP